MKTQKLIVIGLIAVIAIVGIGIYIICRYPNTTWHDC